MPKINHIDLPLKVLQLLLLRYTEMHVAILKPCAEKTKFKNLMIDVDASIELLESFPDIT